MAISKHEHGLAEMIAGEAFRIFDRWLKEHDPDGNMDLLEAAAAYAAWAEKNSITKYCDAANAPVD